MTEDRELQRQNAANAVNWSIECVRAALVLNGVAIMTVLAVFPHEVGDGHVQGAIIQFGLSNYIYGALMAFAGAGAAYLAQRASSEGRTSLRRWFFPVLNSAGAYFVLASLLLFAHASLSLSHEVFPERASSAAALQSHAQAW